MSLFENISRIINESYKWRNRDLLVKKGESKDIKLGFFDLLRKNIFFILVFFVFTFFFQNIINTELAVYLITALSIFIGLFTSVLIMFFDKYISHKSKTSSLNVDSNETVQLEKLRVANFSIKFISITLETILIAISLIILLSSPLLFGDFFKKNIFDHTFKFGLIEGILFLGFVLISVIKTLTILLLFKLCFRLFFIFGFLGEYMFAVLNNKIKNV